MTPILWALRRKSDGFVRGTRDEPPDELRLLAAEVDGDEYVPLFTEIQVVAAVATEREECAYLVETIRQPGIGLPEFMSDLALRIRTRPAAPAAPAEENTNGKV